MQRDWYFSRSIDGLLGVPGVKFAPDCKNYHIHRSHLPLLAKPLASAPKPLSDRAEAWAARDARTEPLGFKLRVTQQQAIDYITQRRGTLLGDDMRLGKTLTALMCHDPADGPLVIIGPLSSRAVWLGWIRRVFPDASVGLLLGKKLDPAVLAHPIIFGHYDELRHWQAAFEIGTLVFDEAHALTNGASWRTKAASFLSARAKRVIALTGTPIWNMPPDLYSVLGLVTPGAWGSFFDFAQRYGAPVPGAHGIEYTGISHEDELNLRLTEVMLRRTWKDASADMPAISRSVVIAEVTEAAGKKLDVIAASLQAERSNTVGNLAAYRRAASLFKLSTVVAEAAKITSRNEPVVIWTWHVDFAKKIAEAVDGFLITGEQQANERERRIEAWRASSNGVLVATMAVAQVAVDFSHARIAIFAEIDWTPGVIAQAEMRTFAPTRGMSILFVVLDHVVDQRLVVALERKLTAASSIGVGAASDSIDALRVAVFGAKEEGDLDRLLDDLLAS